MIKKANITYQSFLRYLLFFLLFLVFNCIEKQVYPYSTCILVYCTYSSCNIILSWLLYLLSFLVLGRVGLLAPCGIICLFFLIVWLLHRKSKHKSEFLYSAYTTIAMISFIILGDNTDLISLERRIIVAVITTLLSLLTIIAGRALKQKGLKLKFSFEEFISLVVVTSIFGLGLCNLISPLLWKTVIAFTILFVCYLFNFSVSSIVCAVLGLSLSLYYGNVHYLSIYLLIGLIAQMLMPISKYFSSLSIMLTDCLSHIIFGIYQAYQIFDLLPLIIGSAFFCILPKKFLQDFKDRISLFKEKQLARQSINRNRLMLSNRLYELSGVFTEISSAFKNFNLNDMSEQDAKKNICNQIITNLCTNCTNKENCHATKRAKLDCIEKMIDIGFAKGRLSLIDMPKNLAEICSKASDVIYYSNRLIADYRSYCLDKQNVLGGRELLSEEADGVAQILRGLALEEGTTLNFQRKTEALLTENLLKNGILVTEVLIYGNGDDIKVSLIVSSTDYQIEKLQRLISNTLAKPMTLCEKTNLTQDKCYMLLRKSCNYDAVFGIAQTTKDGSNSSGDTHSVIKINEQKFLVALSDGMGSGSKAEKVSASALSLIESFYKAGLNSNLILNTANKLLSINSDDTFTALDIAVIDLNSCHADFIKYGSPYGFLISENGIRIIEGNSLPLGILQELKPSICKTSMENENMLLLVTDGISDAFGESSAIIDYLRSVPALNPQSLADGILEKALELSDGKANDDMTALAVRIFKR